MPNILLTTRCNLTCQYCFAQEKLASARSNMSMESVQRVIAFLKRSQFPIFRVMGGEPTLHPQFDEIIQTAIAAGLRVDVLSNVTWSEQTAALFERISPRVLMFLLNVDHPSQYTPRQWAVIERNLERLRGRGGITLSFNIFEKIPRSDYVLDLAEKYAIKYIRLSLSLPVLGAENSYLPIEDLREIAPFVMQFTAQAEARGIGVQFDNAVPMCLFDEAQMGYLLMHGVYDMRRNAYCEPIIDIGPDLTIWSCFCLSSLENRRLDDFGTLKEAQDFYRQVWSDYQFKVYPLEACESCFYREKWGCQGGCLTYAVKKQRQQQLVGQDMTPEPQALTPQTLFKLAEDVHVLNYDIPRRACILRKNSTNLDLEINDGFRPILALLDGQHSLQEITEALPAAQGQGLAGRLQGFAADVLAESAVDFLSGLKEQGFVVIL